MIFVFFSQYDLSKCTHVHFCSSGPDRSVHGIGALPDGHSFYVRNAVSVRVAVSLSTAQIVHISFRLPSFSCVETRD